jgi:hypothetical protein
MIYSYKANGLWHQVAKRDLAEINLEYMSESVPEDMMVEILKEFKVLSDEDFFNKYLIDVYSGDEKLTEVEEEIGW